MLYPLSYNILIWRRFVIKTCKVLGCTNRSTFQSSKAWSWRYDLMMLNTDSIRQRSFSYHLCKDTPFPEHESLKIWKELRQGLENNSRHHEAKLSPNAHQRRYPTNSKMTWYIVIPLWITGKGETGREAPNT